jgi:REP element-mobilizing transposase RayT
MSVKLKIAEPDGIYFITITCYKWLPLFDIADSYDAVYKWFEYLKQNNHFITGYVIMPNHLHALIAFSNSGKNINRIICNGKRFMAYDIIAKLKEKGNENILNQLAVGVNPSDKKRGKLHEVFEASFDIKECYSLEFIKQKLNYIHFNPYTGKWNLANMPENYVHSSAAFYGNGLKGIVPVANIMDIMEIYLSKRI